MESINNSLLSIFKTISDKLSKSNSHIIQDPKYEARQIIIHLKNWTLEEFFLNTSKAVIFSTKETTLLNTIVERRILGEPLAYIVGNKEFFSMNFFVNNDVLIPRNDTETLVEAVINNHDSNTNYPLRILDIGTGSGCIIISLLNNIKNSSGIAIDISEKALQICRKNAIYHNVIDRLHLKESNWLDQLEEHYKFDIIVSNPPYVGLSEQKIMSLDTKFEPEIALYSDNDGLFSYVNIAKQVSNYMKKNSRIYLEIGVNKSEKVKKIFKNYNIECKTAYKDLSGHVRCLELYKNLY